MLSEHTLSPFLTSQFLADKKSSDGADPCSKICAALEGLQLLESHDEGLLRHIIDSLRPHPETAHECSQPSLLKANLLDEPIMIWKMSTHTKRHPQLSNRYELIQTFQPEPENLQDSLHDYFVVGAAA